MKFLKLLIIGLSIAGCFMFPEDETPIEKESYIEISTDKSIEILNDPVDIYEETVETEVQIESAPKRAPKGNVADTGYNFIHKARVKPVEVEGLNVQANDIVLKGNEAYISYNYSGAVFRGALQHLDVSDEENPVISLEIKFEEMDINVVVEENNKIIFGGAANPDIYDNISFIGVVEDIKNPNVQSIIESFIFFDDSYGVTAIRRKDNSYFISVGAEGGQIYETDLSFNVEKTYDISDVRDLEEYKNGVVALKGTTDNEEGAALIFIDNSKNEMVTTYEIQDFSSDYGKANIEIYSKEKIFAGLSMAGFKVYDIVGDNVEEIFSLENPTNDPKDSTNSISFDEKLAFIANGEYGIRILDVKDLTKKDSDFGEIVGYIPYEDTYEEYGVSFSANYAVYEGKYLYVASGAGGVNIYTVTSK